MVHPVRTATPQVPDAFERYQAEIEQRMAADIQRTGQISNATRISMHALYYYSSIWPFSNIPRESIVDDDRVVVLLDESTDDDE